MSPVSGEISSEATRRILVASRGVFRAGRAASLQHAEALEDFHVAMRKTRRSSEPPVFQPGALVENLALETQDSGLSG